MLKATSAAEIRAQDSQAEVLAFLASIGGDATRRIDTHIASIFLAGDRAWKIKRAVRFGYLDFSTPQKRWAALVTELALNRRTAPELYIAVHSINRDIKGQLAIDGEGPALDRVLEMHRFPDGALLNEQAGAGTLDPALMRRLTDRILSFHEQAKRVRSPDAASSFRKVIEGNAASMAAYGEILDSERVRALASAQLKLCASMAPLLSARSQEGRVRHGHGDLHLGNIALIDGEPTLFDCLEFSDELARVDVLYDLSFLLMDLWDRQLRSHANMILNHYLDRSPPDEKAIALLPLFLSVRASIRAHVSAAQSIRCGREREAAAQAQQYLHLAETLLTPKPSRLVAIGGLSGSGKSTLARHIGDRLGNAPGARIFRSDIIRKRLAGAKPETRLPMELYSREASRKVYQHLHALAADAIRQDSAVIVDAVLSCSLPTFTERSILHGWTAPVGTALVLRSHGRQAREIGRNAIRIEADAVNAVRDQPLRERRPIRRSLSAQAAGQSMTMCASDHFLHEAQHRWILLVEIGSQDGRVTVHAERELRQIIGADGKAVKLGSKSVNRQRITRNLGHRINLEAVPAAHEAMMRHRRRHPASFFYRPAERNHDDDIIEAPHFAHLGERTALQRERRRVIRVDVARCPPKPDHRIFLESFKIRAAEQRSILIALEIGHAHDDRARIEGRGNDPDAFGQAIDEIIRTTGIVPGHHRDPLADTAISHLRRRDQRHGMNANMLGNDEFDSRQSDAIDWQHPDAEGLRRISDIDENTGFARLSTHEGDQFHLERDLARPNPPGFTFSA